MEIKYTWDTNIDSELETASTNTANFENITSANTLAARSESNPSYSESRVQFIQPTLPQL